MQTAARPAPAPVSAWFLIVVCLFVTCLIVSNIVAAKLAVIAGLVLPAAVILFPVSYILGDVLTEVYGYGRARQTIWLGFACNLLAVAVIALAGALLAAGRPDAASAELERVLAVDPKSAPAHWVAAQLALSRNDQARAEIAFRRILAFDARHRDARYALGQLELAAERPEEAEKQFAEFLKLEPNAAAAHNARGIALAQMGRMPEARDAFLRCWIAQPGAKAMAVEQHGAIAGYGVIRPTRSGFKVGPLFADDASCAEALFHALAMRVPAGTAIALDVPEPNRGAIALAERHAMSPVFETARMYAGPAPKVPLPKLFGVTTFELG